MATEKHFTVSEAAELLDIPRLTFYRYWAKDIGPEITRSRLGNRPMIKEKDLKAWFKEYEAELRLYQKKKKKNQKVGRR